MPQFARVPEVNELAVIFAGGMCGAQVAYDSGKLALTASVVFAGLWSGLLGMLTLVMHPMLAALNGAEFERFLRAFLPVARKAWFNYVCAIGMAVAPTVALVRLRDDASSAPFVLTAIGLTIVIVGVNIVSNVWKEPLYDVMLAWDPEACRLAGVLDEGATSRSTGSKLRRRGRCSRCFSWR